MRSVHVAITLLITLIVAITSCAPAPASAPRSGSGGEAAKPSAPKRIVAAVRGDPRTLSDAINNAAAGSTSAGVRELEQLVNSGLLVVDLQGNLKPQLAEGAPSIENGAWKIFPDGSMETTWKIKPTARWHDGQPVVAKDFVFTTMVGQDRSQPMQHDEAFKFVDSARAVDDHTFVVNWRSTYVDADKLFTGVVNQMRSTVMPSHLLEPVYAQDKATFTESPYFSSQYVGTGPFKLKEWVLSSHLVLDAHDTYVLGRPKLDGMEVKFILDTNTMVANLLARALDLTLGRGLSPEQAIEVRAQWKDGVVDAGLQNTTSLYPQFMDSEPAILTDARFRRALLMGIDRQQIVDTLLGGFVPVADSIISPDEPEYQAMLPSIVKYPYDPRRASATLDEIGLQKGSDGFYVEASGKRLAVEVRTRSHPTREKVQQVIADEWGRIGVVGEPLVVPEQRISDRAYQATFPGFYFRFGGPEALTEWQSRDTPTAENTYVGRNIIRYQNPDYDALVARFVTAIPRAERLQIMGEMVRVHTDQLTLIPLYHEPEPVLIANRLVNVGGRRGANIQAWNAEEWDIKS